MFNLLSNSIDWAKIGVVLGILAVLAILFTILILVVHHLCAVEEDPKIGQVMEHLSCANCGGCGFAGCADFAKALVEGRASISNCASTSNENKEIIAGILGQKAEITEPMMAIVKCGGDLDSAENKFDYVGNKSCEAKNLCMGGDKVCSRGCLGGGDCEMVCKFNAVAVKNGLANVDKNNCTSCGACVKKCPKHIIELIPRKAKVYIACSSNCKGKEVMNACKVGCIACGLCAKNCPENAITMVDNLPIIDYSKCTGCLTCVSKCPRKTIKTL